MMLRAMARIAATRGCAGDAFRDREILKKNRFIGLLSAVIAFSPLVSAAAESAPADIRPQGAATESASKGEGPTKAEPQSRLIEEIVITAQKREENLQDVPISVQAFSAEALDAKGIEEPKALQLVTPGLTYTTYAGYSIIYIRGVGSDAYLAGDPSVATYIDGIYYPFGHSLATAMGAVERVEVLKGPQGTLFGRNTTGGAINIVTRQPGPDFTTSVLASVESYNKFNVRAFTNLPLTNTLSLAISGLSYREDNYYKLADVSPQKELPKETSRAFSVKGGWNPIDNLSVVLGFTNITTEGSRSLSFAATDPKPLGRAVGIIQQPDYVTSEDVGTFVDTNVRVTTTDIRYGLTGLDLRLLGSRQRIKSPAAADFDGTERPLVAFAVPGQFAHVDTGELQLISNDESWGASWLQWVGGVYYIKSKAGFDPLTLSVAPGLISFLKQPPVLSYLNLDGLNALSAPLLDLVDRLPINGGLDRGVVTLALEGVLTTESTAYFLQGTAKLTEKLAFTLGGRYQTEDRDLVQTSTAYAGNPNTPNDDIVLIPFSTRSAKTSNFSPRVALDYHLGEDLVYVSYSKGFKSGTFNTVAIYLPTQYIPPETTQTYELGYKALMLDGRLRLNAAVFNNQIDNLQVQTISLLSGGAVRLETAGKARIRGADFDLLWEVAPNAIPGLVLTASGAYLDGKYTDYKNGSGFDAVTGLWFDGTIFPARDFTGNETVRTPEFSGTLGLNYSFNVPGGVLELGADAYRNSGFYFSAQNTETTREDAYTLFNAQISYLYEAWNTRITAFGKNVTDAKYSQAVQELDFGTARVLAPPSFYGVRVNWEF